MLPRSPSSQRPALGRLTLPPAEAGPEDWDASPKHGSGALPSERLPRPSFALSGETLRINRSEEWAFNPQGVRRPSSATEEALGELEKCCAADMLEFGVIGRGASSVVLKALHVPTHRVVALKCISVFEKENRAQLIAELRLLCDGSTGGVPGLIRYIGAYFAPGTNTINIALEYMDGGSLEALIQRWPGGVPEAVVARVGADVLEGLSWLHTSRRLIHRDVKPANILLSRSGQPKLSDFGISRGLQPAGGAPAGSRLSAASALLQSSCGGARGTWCYMSPERLNGQPYSGAADVWALGLSLLTAALGRFPYRLDGGPVATALEILEGPPALLSGGERGAWGGSQLMLSFLQACLCADPADRPGAAQARAHAWCAAAPCSHAQLAAFLAQGGAGRGEAAGCGAVHEPADPLASMYAHHFYALMDRGPLAGRGTRLGGLYAEGAMLSLRGWIGEGAERLCLVGPASICGAWEAIGETRHALREVDWQPLEGGGLLVLATGRMALADGQSRLFSDALTLVPAAEEDGCWRIANHWRA